MRTIIVQPTFQTIEQPYEEMLKELPPPRDWLSAAGAGNIYAGDGIHEDIVLGDERSLGNSFFSPGLVIAIERSGIGNSYRGLTQLVFHCDRKEVFGVHPCFIPDTELKKYAFLFDHIVWPASTCSTEIGGSTDTIDFLMTNGLLSRPQFDVSENIYLGNKFFKLFLLAFEYVEVIEGGSASIAQNRDSFCLPASLYHYGKDLRAAEVRLYNALPIPGDGVPLQDILEFKAKHAALLTRLNSISMKFTRR